jgi:hypothetical protein
MRDIFIFGLTVAALVLVLAGCSQPSEPSGEAIEPAARPSTLQGPEADWNDVRFAAAARAFQQQAETEGQALQALCEPLFSAINAFLDNPQKDFQISAQAAWHRCYEQWQRFSLFHHLAFNPAAQEALNSTRRLINSRPFLPGYIDSLPEYPFSGLVHETGLELTLDNLMGQHQMMDLDSASLGFPAVETLLWKTGLDEYWRVNGGDNDTAIKRRHQYLRIASIQLQDLLGQAQLRWSAQLGFTGLSDSTQQRIVWVSLEQQIRQDLLELSFAPDARDEPVWHHPSFVAGQGKRHLLAKLAGLEALLASDEQTASALASWLDRSGYAVSATALGDHLADTTSAISALPDNTPASDIGDEAWQSAATSLTQLADDISHIRQQLSTQNGN